MASEIITLSSQITLKVTGTSPFEKLIQGLSGFVKDVSATSTLVRTVKLYSHIEIEET